MALVLADRVKETTTTTGTGTLTLAGAATGFRSFSVVGNGNTTYYSISSSGGSEFEVGIGTYTASGTTLARTTILASSNAGSAVNLSAGTKDVFVVYPAGKSVNLDASGNATALGTVASATLTNATGLPVSTGISGLGTGVATFLATPSSANLISVVSDETGSGVLVFNSAPALTNPTVTNYVETPYTANSSTAITLALTNGTVQIITLTGTATITMPTATSGKSFILLLKQDATGSRTVTWTTVKWPGGTAPTITATASKQDIYSFFADGTNWYGTTVGQNYTP